MGQLLEEDSNLDESPAAVLSRCLAELHQAMVTVEQSFSM